MDIDTYSTIRNRKNRTAPALKVLKRASKSYEALQQGFLLTLLNKQHFGIVIRKPERRSVKTIQSLVITSLIHPNGSVFEFEKELEKVCDQLALNELQKAHYYALTPQNIDSITEINKVINDGYDVEKLKQIKRHREANRNSIAFNWLVKYTEDLGYQFGKRVSKPAQYTTKMIKIQSLQNESGKIEMNQDVIEYIGSKFNSHVFSQFEKVETHLTINGNDEQIVGLLNNISEVNGTFLKSMYENELNEANGISVSQCNNNTLTNINNDNESEMKSEEIETTDSKAKTVTTMNCEQQPIEQNNIHQSNELNNITNTIVMEEDHQNECNNEFELPEINTNQNDIQDDNQNNEIDQCGTSVTMENEMIDEETYKGISEYYERLTAEPYEYNGFLQDYCYSIYE